MDADAGGQETADGHYRGGEEVDRSERRRQRSAAHHRRGAQERAERGAVEKAATCLPAFSWIVFIEAPGKAREGSSLSHTRSWLLPLLLTRSDVHVWCV